MSTSDKASSAVARAARHDAVPVWLRVVSGITFLLFITWSVMIYLSYAERRESAIAQAQDFAESVNQLTMATLTGIMITGVTKERAVFLDQIRNSNNVSELRVFRGNAVDAQFPAGNQSAAKATADETAAMGSGKPQFGVDEGGGYLNATFPIVALRNYLGKDCLTCHQVKEGAILGAISMRIDLKKTQAGLRQFAWWTSLLALGLSLPLLACVFLLIRRFVSRPLGGEPAAATAVANRIAAGDLTIDIAVSAKDTSSVLYSMKDMQQKLSDIVSRINRAAGSIATAARQIAAGNADLSQRTEEQASSLEETASSMEELTSTVKQSAENARHANQLAAGASEIAVKGGEVVSQVVSTMSGISESSKKIADILGVIDGIAFQTNILALNAAVEAARAGEQGRGFAVVASEVRTLAQRSAAAAKEIKELITDSVAKVDGGTKLVSEAGKTMEDVVSAVKRVTDIMAEITAAAQEQSSGIEQVNQAVMQMDQVTQQNAALVEEAAAAADSMQRQAQALSKAVAVFKVAHAADAVATLRERAAARSEPQVRRERRGPDRAKNVARLPQKAEPSLEAPAPEEPKKTGTADEWSEF